MDGFVKLLYVNLPFGKQLIPQLLYIKDRVWRPVSLLPTTPSRISETKTHTSIFFETEFNSPCLITIDSHEHKCLRLFKDGSGLYECRIDKLENLPIGSSFRHSDFRLNLFHHTSLDTVPKILKSGELWASKSNYEGSVHHDEKNFIYLTGVEKLENHDDLVKVAMVNKGRKIALR
nr:hypothetical protein [Chloroflexota bacterium]